MATQNQERRPSQLASLGLTKKATRNIKAFLNGADLVDDELAYKLIRGTVNAIIDTYRGRMLTFTKDVDPDAYGRLVAQVLREVRLEAQRYLASQGTSTDRPQ